MYEIAILLAAYNGKSFIEEQLATVFSQQDVNIDIYISVDLSTDSTYDYCLELSQIRNNVFVLPYGERFGGAGPNFYRLISDVDFSNYDFIAFADQDDVWHPDKLIRACKCLSLEDTDAYSSNLIAFWPDGKELLIDKAQPQKDLDYFFQGAGAGCTIVIRKKVMLEIQAFVSALPISIRKSVLHDWLMYAFCRSRGYKWFIDPEPSMRYRQHESNQVGSNNNLKAYKKRFLMIKNKEYRKQVELLASVLEPNRMSQISNRYFLIKNQSQLRRKNSERYFLLIMLILGIY